MPRPPVFLILTHNAHFRQNFPKCFAVLTFTILTTTYSTFLLDYYCTVMVDWYTLIVITYFTCPQYNGYQVTWCSSKLSLSLFTTKTTTTMYICPSSSILFILLQNLLTKHVLFFTADAMPKFPATIKNCVVNKHNIHYTRCTC